MAAAALLWSCAKETGESTGEALQRYIEAWAGENCPNAEQTPLGAYIIEEEEGSGTAIGDSLYVRVKYTTYALDGTISSSTEESINRQIDKYTSYYYYGPVFWYRGEEQESLYAGVEELIADMKIGGRKKVLIPGWLLTSDRYDSKDQYIKKTESSSAIIYDVTLVDALNDEEQWEKDSLARYIAANFPDAVEDSIGGFYYIQTVAPESDSTLNSSSTVYADYIARRLDGTAFDTTVADTAKMYNFYSSSTTYSSKKITLDDNDYTETTMASSSLIKGFAYALDRMHYGEAATVIFWSGLGYSSTGSGNSVPAYCPLRFDISIDGEDEH